jgi:hypothetical protein
MSVIIVVANVIAAVSVVMPGFRARRHGHEAGQHQQRQDDFFHEYKWFDSSTFDARLICAFDGFFGDCQNFSSIALNAVR